MKAVLQLGSKQYRVEAGSTLETEKIDAPVGATLEISDLISIGSGGDVSFGGDVKGKVTAEVMAHVKAPKIIVFKRKRRKGFHQKQGHRQNLTRLKIVKVEA